MRYLIVCLFLFNLSTNAVQAQQPKATKSGVDWPKFLGPFGTSISPEKGIINPWPKKGLRVIWHTKVGEGYCAPTISKGCSYHFDRGKGETGGKTIDGARLRCFDSVTGKLKWHFVYPSEYKDKYDYDTGPRCCPVIDGDRIYLYGVEGMLHCLRVKDGSVIWKLNTIKKYDVIQNFFGVGSTPVIEGDLLIVMIGGSPKDSDARDFVKLKGNGTGIVAFNKYTGKEMYRITDELASYSSPVLATIDGRRWCFAFCRGGLVAFHPKTGKVDFHFPWRSLDMESVNASNPVVIGDRVFLSETYGPGGALLKVKTGDYKVLWSDKDKTPRKKSMQCHWMTPIVHDGYLYGCSGRHDANAKLHCIELKTGKVMWSQPRLGRTSLLMVDGHFVCHSEIGPLLLLRVNPKKFDLVSILRVADPKSGEELLLNPCWAAPVLSHGLMYVRGRGHLVCLELIPRKK